MMAFGRSDLSSTRSKFYDPDPVMSSAAFPLRGRRYSETAHKGQGMPMTNKPR